MIALSHLHVAEASYASNLYPMDVYLLSMLLELYKKFKQLELKLAENGLLSPEEVNPVRGIVSLQLDDQDYYAYPAGTVLKIPFNTKMNLNNFNPETLELILIKAPPPDVLPE